ncbi:MAG: hypothetical protein IKQ60_04795 [Candidatus Methanomethylophilaceae archaeon]|nr:hypothetical protein [Candidatus Methanomethylophilaceae archaeon]
MESPSVHAPLFCERCGVSVKQGSCYNSMGTDPLILCNDCYSKVSDVWNDMNASIEARKAFIVDSLCERPVTRRYLQLVPKGKDAIRVLREEGYSISVDGSDRYVLLDSPELDAFSRSLATCQSQGDGEWIRRTYSEHWDWLSAAYSDRVGQPRTGDPLVLMSYCSQANEVPERFERMTEDEALRKRVRMSIREQVFLKLLDLVIAECEGVIPLGTGRAEFKGVVMTYGPVVDESMIGERSGFDCDILVGEDSVDCFADEDIVPFVEYFEQGSNEKVVAMLDYMCGLRRRGLRWYPSFFRWTQRPSPLSSRQAWHRYAPGSQEQWPTASTRRTHAAART